MEHRDLVLPPDIKGAHVHFVGIKGTGMAALVEILFARGAVITGSDVSERFYTDEILERLGIPVLGFSGDNITDSVQYVIYSSAYNPEKNPDLVAAGKRKIPMLLYTQALGEISASVFSCGICGVHGKTTTTGLAGTILRALDLPSQVLAGSMIASFGSSCTMTSPSFDKDRPYYFVAETCEYQRHFMSFCPGMILLTSVESDHQDYYPTYESIRDAFVDYVCKLPAGGVLIYCADDDGAREVMSLAVRKRSDIRTVGYGESADGDYKLTFVNTAGAEQTNGRQLFSLQAAGDIALVVPGRHNALNAAGAVALCNELLLKSGRNPGDCKETVRKALLEFTGGKRRSEVIARTETPLGESLIVLDDYAHHPTAIKSTLRGYREFYGGRRIVVDFMSHTYTRTSALLDDFASSFESADDVFINKIYASAREDASSADVSGEILSERAAMHKSGVRFCKEFDEAAAEILGLISGPSGDEFPCGWLLVTMGAGDNWKVGRMVLDSIASAGKNSNTE